jgi:chromosomal replication initiation ATPase DnaA
MPAAKRATDQEVERIIRALIDRGFYRPLLSICRRYHVTLDDVIRKVGTRQVARARDACFAAVSDAGLSRMEVGKLMGFGHSTVTYAIQRHHGRGNT